MNPNETQGSDGVEADMENQVCPTCGMDRKDWSKTQGYQQGGEAYCCEGCAEGTGCTCSEETEKAGSNPPKRTKRAA